MNNLNALSPKIDQPTNIKMPFKEHQKTAIYHMRKLEDERSITHHYDEEQFYLSNYTLRTLGLEHQDIKSVKINTSYAVLADKVGSGKTLMIVGLLNNKIKLDDCDKILSSTMYSSVQIKDNKKCLKTNLILVPHSLTTQWNDAFKNSSLKYYVITKRKDIEYLEFDDHIDDILETGLIEEDQCLQYYDVIICSANMFADYFHKFRTTKYSRIIIDEVLQIKLPADFNWCCNFAWFVTATPTGLQGIRRHYIKELIGGIVQYHHLLTIKNNDDFVDQSMRLPDIIYKEIRCLTPKELLIVKDLISKDIINMINGNNHDSGPKQIIYKTGTENMDKITYNEVSTIFDNEISSVIKLIELVNFSENKPENHQTSYKKVLTFL
jgi:hypothetical protein